MCYPIHIMKKQVRKPVKSMSSAVTKSYTNYMDFIAKNDMDLYYNRSSRAPKSAAYTPRYSYEGYYA